VRQSVREEIRITIMGGYIPFGGKKPVPPGTLTIFIGVLAKRTVSGTVSGSVTGDVTTDY